MHDFYADIKWNNIYFYFYILFMDVWISKRLKALKV